MNNYSNFKWYFYVRQRDRSHEWKCQPDKFLTPELARHEVIFGSLCLSVVSIVTGFISWYIANNGKYLKIYYQADEYGWIWFFLQVPVVFVYQVNTNHLIIATNNEFQCLMRDSFQDYMIYQMHRAYHTPLLYKHFHKLHHKYKQPTAFSVTTIHPVEMVSLQLAYVSPMFLVPVHWSKFSIFSSVRIDFCFCFPNYCDDEYLFRSFILWSNDVRLLSRYN